MTKSHSTSHSLHAWLELMRISNSPTVVTNVLAGSALAGALTPSFAILLLIVSAMLFYHGGMIMNDVCDYGNDRIHRPERPLPRGAIRRKTAGIISIIFLAGGIVLLSFLSKGALLGGLILVSLIVLYNVWHKENPLGPLIMAGCRSALYVIAFLAFVPHLNTTVIIAGTILALYVLCLTLIAKCGDKKGRIVSVLIAGICLYDAMVMGFSGSIIGVYISIMGFLLTLFLQRYIHGT